MVAGARRGGRRHILVGALLLALVVSGHCLDAHHGSRNNLKRRRRKHEIHSPVKTVVVVVMENRSFDHVLGWLRAGRPDIDGLTGAESNRLNLSDPASPEIFVTDRAGYVDSDPGHGFEDIREQIFGSADTSATTAPMSGFAQNARGMGLGMPQNVMSGFAPDSVPVYAALADEFAVFDRWFASVPTSTQPNRLFVHSATSHGLTFNARKDLINGFPQKTIFDSLEENQMSVAYIYARDLCSKVS